METVKCPGCSSGLVYDLEDEILRCNYCGTVCTVQEAKITDKQFLEDRLMDVHEAVCPDCGARLITDINTISAKCVYCNSSIIYDEKVNKVFKPKKILNFEICLEEAKERLNKFLEDKKIKNRDKIVKSLKAVYIPFWLYNSKVYVEYDKDNKIYVSNFECKNILADASIKIGDVLTDKFDDDFDFSKLKDFELSLISGHFAEEFDVTAKQVYRRVERKMEDKARLKFSKNARITNTVDDRMYILLPFYYVEFYEKRILDGYQVLINGQNGNVNIEKNRMYIYKEEKIELPIEFYISRFVAVSSLLIFWIILAGIFIVFVLGTAFEKGNLVAILTSILLLLFSIIPLYITIYLIRNLYQVGYLFNMTEEKKKIYMSKYNRRKRY